MSMIKVVDLEKRYKDQVILEKVNVEIKKGEVISIIGPSGTGKSTFLRAINFLDPATKGEVYYEGERIDKSNVNAIRRKMGMVFQNFGLFSHLDVMGNLCVGATTLLGKTREQAEEKAMQLLEAVGLKERAHHYPSQLSGGQKQRVAIARCLSMEPDVILFDEPTSALDPTMVGEVMAVIRNLASTGLTIMIVTHEMRFAQDVSSRIFYMDERGIYEEGTPEQIFNNPTRPKTQAFINKVRSFDIEITSKDFDYVQMLAGIDHFCFNHGVNAKNAQKLRLIAEELVINIVVPKLGACHLTVSFSEKLEQYEVKVTYPGEGGNILEGAEDTLALKMIRGVAHEIVHKHEGAECTLQLRL